MSASITFLLFAGILTISNGLPNTFQCARYCKEFDKNTFGYESERTYTYKYNGDVRSLINSTYENVDESGVKLDFLVDIHSLSTCEFAMQISSASNEEYHIKNTVITTQKSQIQELEKNVLYFSYHNGKIATICPDGEDTTEILNVKKAVLSVFQNSMQDLDKHALVYESDITGTCETTYKVLSNEPKETVVEKTKNLNACSHRMSQYLSWQTVPYATNFQAKSLPLLRSGLKCTQKYNELNILTSSSCEEKHVFQPFSQGDSGAVTVVKQEMTLLSYGAQKYNLKTPRDVKRTSLVYEGGEKEGAEVDISGTLQLISELEKKTADGVDADVPKLFSKLVFDFQSMDQAELLNVFKNIKQNNRKFFIDAISLVTTTSGIEVMKQLYTEKMVTKKQIDSWIISLSFIKHPTLETITAVQPLMKMNTTRQNTILAVSSIIYRYCRKDVNCLDRDPILQAMKDIERPLQNNCRATSADENNDILLSLKGLGNAGVTTSLNLLQSCYSNDNLPIELRLAAIAAHRRMSCVRNFNLDDFKNYFGNPRENTEIRIASYLATMQCASYAVFAQVKDVLMREKINQVGSFVWTHITNLQETSVQWKQGIKKLLENEFLKNKFNTDIRKYSRNYEASTFFDTMGVGGAVESNVIFTAESYLPRSAMLNFTLDLFGETINVFEVGARLEGFEEIVENFFGPEGYFTDKSIKTFLENVRQTHETTETSDKIAELGDNFRAQKMLDKDPAGLLYAKIFGNEFSYTHFKTLQELIGDPIAADRAIDFFLNLFRENDIDYTKSFIFLDSSYKIPTIIGLPLELVANGTATLGLTVKGKLDLQDLWSYKMAIEGKIYPSAAMQVVGTMSVSTFGGRIGVKYIGQMNTNTYIDGHVFINSGKVVDLKINMPKQQMDIISVTSDVFILHNQEVYKIQDITDNIEDKEMCTQKIFSAVTGLQICHHMRYVNASEVATAPYFPLTGSFKYGMNIKKTDVFDSYQLHLKTQVEERTTSPLYSMSLYIDTPNSLINRKILASYRLNLETLSLNAKLHSPFTSFEINSNIGKESNKYSFQLETLYNDKEIVSLKSTFNINHAGYDSLAKLKYQQIQIAAVSGSLKYLHTGKYAANLKLEGITGDPIEIIGDLVFYPNSINVRSSLTSKAFSGDLQWQLKVDQDGVIVNSNLDYSINAKKEKMTFLLKMNKLQTPLLEHNIILKFENTHAPIYNLLIDLKNEREPWYYKNYIRVTFFETTWRTEQQFKFHKDKATVDFDTHAYIKCEEKNIDYQLLLLYNTSKLHYNAHALIQLNKIQRIEGAVNYSNKEPEETIKVLVYYPRQSWSVDGLLRRESSENYFLKFNGFRTTDGTERKFIEIAGDYTNSSVDYIQDHKINCTLDLPESNGRWATPWIITASFQKSRDVFLSFSQLKTRSEVYVGHMNWMQDNFAFILQANGKRLFVANAAQNNNVLSVLLALNVYQHFELSSRLVQPYDKFDLKFYWDKDRDETQKFVFGVEKNVYKGLYNMDVEYPNQKVAAAFVLLPTQVTMNVTWGIKVSQRIYLKVGNKIYDVGGIWFGELETPFQYLEKQEFQLKYYIVSKSFEVQSDISWRHHSINLLVSGSKLNEHLSGVIQLNTTLPEISRVGAAMTHAHQSDDNYKTDAIFRYNEHQVTAQSNWKINGLQVNSNFRVESRSDTIQPIAGMLLVNSNDSNNLLLELYWQAKSLKVESSFKSDTSSIKINTPFEGFENTTLKYSVKAYPDKVLLKVTVDLLGQYNNVYLRWSNLDDSMEFWMDLVSPVTGYYSLQFTHSTVLGILKESFTIKGHEQKDIIMVSLEGYIVSLLEMNLVTFLKLLEHRAMLTIEHNSDPISSVVRATWDEFEIESSCSIGYDTQSINAFNWVITSNALPDENIEITYYHHNDNYKFLMQLPKRYILTNELYMAPNYEVVENAFRLTASEASVNLDYKHKNSAVIFTQNLKASYLNRRLDYNFTYSVETNPTLNVILTLPYDSNHITFITQAKSESFDSAEFKFYEETGRVPIEIAFRADAKSPKMTLDLFVRKSESTLNVSSVSVNHGHNGEYSLSSVTTGEYFYKYLNAKVKSVYNFDQNKILVVLDVVYNKQSYNLDVKLSKSFIFNLDVILKQNQAKLAALELAINKSIGNALLIYKTKSLRVNYLLNDKNCLELNAGIRSTNIELIPNCKLNASITKDKKLYFDLEAGTSSFITNATYNLNLDNQNRITAELDAYLYVDYTRQSQKILNLDLALDGKLEAEKTNGKMLMGLKTNLVKVKNVELSADYNVENKGYETSASYKQNSEVYKIDFNNFRQSDAFEISTQLTTPNLGLVRLEINTLKKYNEYTTQFILTVNDNIYAADVITTYVSLLDFASGFQINLPDKYAGNFEIKLNELQLLLNTTLKAPNDSFNKAALHWKKGYVFGTLQLNNLIPEHNLAINYNLDHPTRSFTANLEKETEQVFTLTGEVTLTKLNVRLHKGNQKDYIVMGGNHKFNSLRDFSISYGLFKDGNVYKIDLLNYFGEIYQTTLDVSTHIRGWNRITLESKIDDEKIRISLNARNHHMSLDAKKFTSKGDEILSIQFQGETLLEIWSAAGQMILRTSSRFGQYRLFVQCTDNPGIYGLSILKNGQNLISIMLQNLTTTTDIHFMGQITAPELLSPYSNLSLHFNSDYNLAKSMQFNAFNHNVSLFGIKWFTQAVNGGYRGYLKFNSLLDFLENFEIHPSLEGGEDLVLSMRLAMSSYNNRKEYYAFLLLPGENSKTKISLVYPCEMYTDCNFYFVLEPSNLDFHWSTPFERWKNISLRANLQYSNGSSLGLFKIKNVKSNFDLAWMYKLNANSIIGNFSTHNNFRTEYFRNLEVTGKYSFYKSLSLNYSVEGFPGTFHGEFVNDVLAKSLKIQNKGHGINMRIFGNMNYNEDAQFNFDINNRTIAAFKKGKINGKSHTQFFKIKSDFYEFTGDLFYNLADSQLASFGVDFEGVHSLNATLTANKDISNGNGSLVIRSGSFASDNKLIWSSNLFKPNTKISIDFMHNNHTTKIKLDHLVEQLAVNSSLIISCGGRGMELYLIGEMVKGNELMVSFILKTPLDVLKDVHLNARLRHGKNDYSVYYILRWPQHYMTMVSSTALNPHVKIFDLEFSSSFTKSLRSNVEFKREGDRINFNFGTEAGDEFIRLKSLIVAGLRLNGNLTTTFEGYKTCNVTSQIDKEAGTASTKISKENLTLEMLGKFSKSNNNYEMNMQVNYPDGAQDVGTAFLKFNNNNFNASLKFVNNDVKMDFGLDNNLYNIYLKSPYEYAKEINLKGIYTNNVNIYSLETDGKWNGLSIDFNGILKLYPDNQEISLFGNAGDSQGKLNLNYKQINFIKTLNFEAYFPKPEVVTYFKFEGDTTNTSFAFKSPFQVSELQLKSTILPYEMLEIEVFGNIQNTPVFWRVKGTMDASSINAYFSLDGFATSRVYITVKADENEGALIIKQEQQENFNNINLNYTFVPNKFLSNFVLTSSRYNTSHSLSLLYKTGDEIEYGIILNDCELIESIQITSADIKTRLYLNLPYYNVKSGFLLNKRSKISSSYTEAKLFYNNNEIEGELTSDNQKSGNLTITYVLPNLLNNGSMNSVFEKGTGFTLVTKHKSEFYSTNSTTIYLNNKSVFEFTTIISDKYNNHHAKFYFDKTLENIRVDIKNILKIELANKERSKLIFSMKNHKLEAELNTNAILIKVNSPLISQKALEIILNAFTESSYKQFKLYYKENNVQAYKALLTFENSKENLVVAKIDLHKVFTRVINLRATLSFVDYLSAFVSLKAYGELHTGNLTVDIDQPYVVHVDLSSPYLKNNHYTLQMEATTLRTITFYVSSGNKSLENYILFQSIFQGKTMNIDLQIPKFNSLRLFKFVVEWDFEVNNTSKNYLEIHSDIVGNILAQADFIYLEKFLDIETHFRIPFLKNCESFDSKIYIPKEFRPKIEFKLPNNVTYSLHFNHSISAEHVFIDAGYECNNKFNVILDYAPQEYLEFEMVVPSSKLEYISISLKPLIYKLDFNHNVHKFTYNYKNLDNHKLFQAILQTPFEYYKEYSVDFEYKSGLENKIKFLIYSPNHNKIGLNFDFKYSNLMLFKLNYNIYTPYSIRGFDFLEIQIVNELNSGSFYTVEYSALTNNYNLTLNVGCITTDINTEILIDSKLNNEKLFARFQLIGNVWEDSLLLIHFETPIDYLSHFKVTFETHTSFRKLKHNDLLEILYKNNSIISSKLLIEKSTVSLHTLNIWRSFSIDYKYSRDYKSLDALAKICWDLEKVKESQIGARLSLDNNLSSALYLPNNTFTFDAVTEKNEINESYYWKASWNQNDVSMATAVTNLTTPEEIHVNTHAYLQLPFRTFKVIQNIDILLEKTPGMNSTVEYIWGDEATSKFILKNEILPGKLTSRLITKALEHEVALKLDMSKFNCIPSIITAEFEYSDDPEKLLQFEIYYNKTLEDGFATERNFIFKHLASKIDYELYFNALRRSNYSNGSIVLKYRNFDSNTPESIRASVKVDHDKFGVHGEVETSRNTFNFKAASTSEEDSLGFLTLTKVNEKDPLHLEYKYDFKQLNPSVNFIASYGESRKYDFYAGLPNDREITAKLGHEYYGKHSLDSLLTMKLNTSQLLWVKILWKKEVYPQFYKAIFEEYNDLRFVIEATGKELIDVINDDIGKVLINDLSYMKQKIITYAKEEKKKFVEDFANNQFTCPANNYICTILNDSKIMEIYDIIFGPIKQFFYGLHQILEQSDWFGSIQYTFDVISDQIERTLKDIKNIKNIKINAKDILKRGISDARKSLKEMETIAIKLLDDLDKYVSYLKEEIEEFFEPFLNLLDDLVAYVEQRLALLQIAVLDILDKIQYYIYNLRETKEMLLVYSSYINWLEELHVTDVLEPLGDVIEEILDTIITDVKKVTEHYKPYLDALSEAAFGKYDGINELPPITEFREFVTRFYHKTIWIWNYHNMTETLKVFIQRLSNDIDDVLLFIELDESNGDFENHIGQADYIFRPEMGLIEISQPLWFEWVAFNKPPNFETYPLYQKIQRKADQFVKIYKSRYDLIDGLESLLEDLSEPTVAPATYNFAMVIGKNHFATFNNHYYNFLSNCSYLLASDFKTNSFSLLVNFHKENNEVKRTFEILTGGGSIVIDPDYLISLDGKKVNLPLIYQHVTVLKEYESITIESTKGFKMICNSHYDFCTIQLSGWLFGKTAGLLGTLDNEKVTDTNTSNGTQTTSLQEFTNSWKLQEQCALELKENNHDAQIPALNGLMGKLCNLFFANKNSPLTECFDIIPPKPYLEMCVEYMQDQTKTAMCSSIAAYKVRCRKAGVHLEMPELCVQCEDDIAFREKIYDGQNPKSLDIVFITQLNCFNFNMSLPQSLNEQLSQHGYSNNKFASIGFGGNTLTKPHVYSTKNGGVWNDEHTKIKYKYGYKRLNLPPFKAVDAIKYASNLNFRPGISKLFILLQCDATTEMENAPQIYNMLGEKDITLHVVKPKPLGNFSSDNYAIDGIGHVLSNFDVPANADEVISQIDDVYSGLALTTNGTIYDSDYISDATTWANFVVRTVKKSPCQKCKCVPDSNGVGKVECTRCLNPAVKQFLNEYESNNKMRFGNTDISDE